MRQLRFALLLICLAGVASAAPSSSSVDKEALKKFASVIKIIDKNHAAEPSQDAVSESQNNGERKKYIDSAIIGMTDKLDNFSYYIENAKADAAQQLKSSEFRRIGVAFAVDGAFVRVLTPIQGSPAEEVGIRTGDIITSINGMATSSYNLEETVNLIDHEKDQLSITIMREYLKSGVVKPITFEIDLTDQYFAESAYSFTAEDDIGVIRIANIRGGAEEQFKWRVSELIHNRANGMKGLIIDLRNATGDSVDAAREMANTVINKEGNSPLLGSLVMNSQELPNQEFEATEGDMTDGIPIVTLINHGTSGTAEFVSSALKEHRRSILIGSKTYGKGAIQSIVDVAGGESALKITAGHLVSSSGHDLAEGVSPSITIAELSDLENKEMLELRNKSRRAHKALAKSIKQKKSKAKRPKKKRKQRRTRPTKATNNTPKDGNRIDNWRSNHHIGENPRMRKIGTGLPVSSQISDADVAGPSKDFGDDFSDALSDDDYDDLDEELLDDEFDDDLDDDMFSDDSLDDLDDTDEDLFDDEVEALDQHIEGSNQPLHDAQLPEDSLDAHHHNLDEPEAIETVSIDAHQTPEIDTLALQDDLDDDLLDDEMDDEDYDDDLNEDAPDPIDLEVEANTAQVRQTDHALAAATRPDYHNNHEPIRRLSAADYSNDEAIMRAIEVIREMQQFSHSQVASLLAW